MDSLLSTVLPTAGLAFTLAGAIYATFKWLNKSISVDLRDEVALWILGETRKTDWSRVTGRLFDQVFGVRALSRHRVVSVLGASFFVASAQFFWANSFVFTGKVSIAAGWYYEIDVGDWLVMWILVGLFATPSLYFSIPKTRWLLKRLARSPKLFLVPAIVLEIGASVVISAIWQDILRLPFYACPPDDVGVACSFFEPYNQFLADNFWLDMNYAPIVIIMNITTIWMLLVVACVLLRLTTQVLSGISKHLGRLLNQERIEKEPLTLFGEVLAGLVFLVICLKGLGSA